MKKIIFLIISLSLVPSIVFGYTVKSGESLSSIANNFNTTWQELWKLNPEIENPNLIYKGQEIKTESELLGATLPVAGVTYSLAGSGITGSATSITLASLTIPQTGYELVDSDFSDTFYITLEPGNTKRQEIASCTTITQNANNTATLSGCSRGLVPFTPYTASTTYQFSHGGGTTVIFSDPPQLFNEFAGKSNSETITRVWTFEQHPVSSSTLGTPTSTYQYTTKQYVDNVTNQGAATSTEDVAGISEQATQLEMASSTQFDVNNPHFISSEYATSSPGSAGLWVPITQNDGKLSQSFTRLSDSYTWTGGHTFASSTHTTSTHTNIVIGGVTSNNLSNGLNADSLHLHEYNSMLMSTTTDVTVTSAVPVPLFTTTTIPANTLTSNNVVVGTLSFSAMAIQNTASKTFNVRYGNSAAVTLSFSNASGADITTMKGWLTFELYPVSASSQEVSIHFSTGITSLEDQATDTSMLVYSESGTFAINSAIAQPFVIEVVNSDASAESITFANGFVEVKR